MRNLTLKRDKAFPACAVAMRVYIEDPSGTDIIINGVPCKKLGEIKNGKEDTYAISDAEAKLYVIPEKSGSVTKYEYFQIPEGTDDVSISGKNVFDSMNGNPFRFNGLSNEFIENARRNDRIKSIIIVAVAVFIGIAVGLARTLLPTINKSTPMTVTVDNMEITLDKSFKKYDHPDYAANYNSDTASLFVIKDSFSDYPEITYYTVAGYAEFYADFYTTENVATNLETKTEGELIYLSFEAEGEDGNIYHYYEFFFKTNDAFWIVEFAVEKDQTAELLPQVIEWAKTVKFS